jgi:hypothetical protein
VGRKQVADRTRENRVLALRVIEDVFNGGDLGVIDEVYAPDCVHGLGRPPTADRGVGELKRNVALVRVAFPDLRVTVEDQVAASD